MEEKINRENGIAEGNVVDQVENNAELNSKKTKKCPTCGCVVAKSASSCPQCGHKLKKKGRKVAIGCLTPVLIIAILIGVFVFSLQPDKGEIGETYTNNGVEFKVNTIEFAEVIDGWGGANDNYWFPLTEENYQKYYNDGNVQRWNYEAYVLKNGLKPKDESDMMVFISYTAKNVGKSDRAIDDLGVIDYDDGYEYREGSLAWRRTETAVWQDIPNGIILEKLKENEYEFRAYIILPKEAVKSDKSLKYTLYGVEYDLRK